MNRQQTALVYALLLCGVGCGDSPEAGDDPAASTLRFANLADGQAIDGPLVVEVSGATDDVELLVDGESQGTFVDGAFDWYPLGQGDAELTARSLVEEASATVTVDLVPRCGDGIEDRSELCDDANLDAGDGCSAACMPEIGFGEAYWTTSLAQDGYGDVLDTAIDVEGNTFIVGTYGGNTDFEALPVAEGERNVYLARVDSLGELSWVKTFESFVTLDAAVETDSSGAAVIYGHFRDSIDLGNGPIQLPYDSFVGAAEGAFLAKFDAEGERLWSFGFESFIPMGAPLAVDEDDRAIVVFRPNHETFIDGVELPSEARSVMTVSADGEVLSVVGIELGGVSTLFLEPAPDGDVYIVGRTAGPLRFGDDVVMEELDSFLDARLFAVRLRSDGSARWAKTFGGEGDDHRVHGVATDADGSLAFVGQFEGGVDFGAGPVAVEPQEYEHQEIDAFAVRFDSSGEVVWQQLLQGPEHDRALGVTFGDEGIVYMTAKVAGDLTWNGGSIVREMYDFGSTLLLRVDNDGVATHEHHWDAFHDPDHLHTGPGGSLIVSGSFDFGDLYDADGALGDAELRNHAFVSRLSVVLE